MLLDVERIREDFPILSQRVRGRRLAYLDSAASSHCPRQVLNAIADYYRTCHSAAHRGLHVLSTRATEAYERARQRVAKFIGAHDPDEVVFTRSATEALNLVAEGYGRPRLRPGDVVVMTMMEHHSSSLPWQRLVRRTGATVWFVPQAPDGTLDVSELDRILDQARFVVVTLASNVLGVINPVDVISRSCHRRGAVVVVDAAQAVPHLRIDVHRLGADFVAFSGHKMLAPAGIGVLWGRRELLADMEPLLVGGGMASSESIWADPPARFEAGTPNVAGAVGLEAAMDYLDALGMDAISQHVDQLVRVVWRELGDIPGIKLHGPLTPRVGVISFEIQGIHPHDVAGFLDKEGVAIRAGHHCAKMIVNWLGCEATNRVSLFIYNGLDDVEQLSRAVRLAKDVLT